MYTGVSNLATSLQMARTHGQTKQALSVASQEVASGKKANLLSAAGGDFGPLFALERSLKQLSLQGQTIKNAAEKAAATQLNMENFGNTLAGLGSELLGAVGLNNQAQAFAIASSARSGLDRMVSSLNAQYGGQSLFSGANVDRPAVADASTIYADVTALTLAAPDSLSAIAAVDDYFLNPTGGFMTSGYLGSPLDAPKAELANGEVVNYSMRGDDISIRQALRNVVLAAVAANGDHGGSDLDGMNMLKDAAQNVISTKTQLINLRENLGHVEAQIETAAAKNTAESTAFEINRNAIIAADPYEAATRFQALEGQMEAIYLMTSRLSGLRLQNYLR